MVDSAFPAPDSPDLPASRIGRGSTAGALDSCIHDEAGRTGSGPAGRRVLVVDDHDDCRATMVQLVRMAGCEARGADDGQSALRMAAAWHPDVILMDLALPQMDGCELAGRMRCLPYSGQPLIIAVTGWGGDAVRTRAKNCGIDGFFVKPVAWDQLAALLGRPGLAEMTGRRASVASGGTA